MASLKIIISTIKYLKIPFIQDFIKQLIINFNKFFTKNHFKLGTEPPIQNTNKKRSSPRLLNLTTQELYCKNYYFSYYYNYFFYSFFFSYFNCYECRFVTCI